MPRHKATDTELLAQPRRVQPSVLIAIMVVAAALGSFVIYRTFAASASISATPATASVNLGATVTVAIRENSSTDSVNATEADFTYDQTKLQFVSIDTSASAFDLDAPKSGGSGTVSIARASSTGLTGDQLVATVTFTAIGTGSSSINFATTSAVVRSSDTTNILAAKNSATYTVVDATPPSVPAGLTAPTRTVNSVALNWTASTDNVAVTGYRVFRNGTQISTPTTNSATDTGLVPNTSYSYSVAAVDAAGNVSAQSTPVSFSTLPDTSAPTVPSGLVLSSRTITAITLSWTASTDNVAATGYRVFRNGTQIGTPSAASYTDSGLTPGTSYSYTVAATDAAGNVSAQSAVVALSTLADTAAPSVPTGLTSPTQASTTISLSWGVSTDNVAVTGYRVFRNGTQVATPTATSYTDTGLTQGVSYAYTVAATDAAGNVSAQSAAVNVLTPTKAGDVTGDGAVSINDLSVLAFNYNTGTGKTRAQGDLNGDGVVNVFDLSILATNWGK